VRSPYAPPDASIRETAGRRISVRDLLVYGIPATIYALHGLILVAVIVYLHLDPVMQRETEVMASLRRPLVFLQPACSLFAAAMLMIRHRIAVVGACALPVIVAAHAQFQLTDLPVVYLGIVTVLALYVLALTLLRKPN
jgi:hypothetical protein